eukprot:m.25426 g.25426  ORF g.25426 m.25426 type:complete len:319 (-) comp4430_c0_seq1:2782-3738(-)
MSLPVLSPRTVAVVACVGAAVAAVAAALALRRARVAERAAAAERTGRVRAECAARSEKQQQNQLEGYNLFPVGYARTCFPERRGTPRQGVLAPATRATVALSKHVPFVMLDGLEQFSHVWLIFIFHENTNLSSRKAAQVRGRSVKAKVAPPQLGGRRVGLFSTRTPHRPNPVGLSVVRIEAIDLERGELLVSGVDLVDGTPILDIKPYIEPYDSLPDARVPQWIAQPSVPPKPVHFADAARATLEGLSAESLTCFSSVEEAKQALEDALRLDIRGVHQRRGQASQELFEVRLDTLHARFSATEDAFLVERISIIGSEE